MEHQCVTKPRDTGVRWTWYCVCIVLTSRVTLVSPQCPQQCECDHHGVTAVCRARNVTDPPEGKYNPEVQFLDLSANRIETLKNSSFFDRDLLDLRYLNLSHNKMSVIETDSLRGAAQLEILDLSWNNIVRMAPEVFADVRNLSALYLNNNLFILLLEYDLPNLITLDLNGCGIQTWPHNFFSDMGNIHHLNLSNNKISQVEMHGIEGLKLLATLNLQNNSLRVLQRELLRLDKSIVIELSANPWRCDCTLMGVLWLYEERTYRPPLKCAGAAIVADLLNCNTSSKQQGGMETWKIICIASTVVIILCAMAGLLLLVLGKRYASRRVDG